MLAVKLLGNGHAKVVQVPRPEPEKGWVLVKTEASALCGGDLHTYFWDKGSEAIPGHEIAGQVAEVGKGVTRFGPKDRVAINAVYGCGVCEFCRRGDWIFCNKITVIAGGDAEYVAVPERNCFPLPSDVSFEQGALLGDGVGTPYRATKRLGINGTHTVALFGLGPVGLGALTILKFLNCRVIASEVSAYRRKMGKTLGADVVIDPSEHDPIEIVKEHTQGKGVDAAIECVGKEITENQALDCAKKGGRVAFLGQNRSATIKPSGQLIAKELTVIGSWYYNAGEYEELIALIRRGLIPERIITHRFGLKEAQKAFSTFASGKSGKVIFAPDTASAETGNT